MPTVRVQVTKEDNCMSKLKVMLASALDTLHGLGVSGFASCLLTKGSLTPNNSFKPMPLRGTA